MGASLLTTTSPFSASADPATKAGEPEKSYTGAVVGIDAKEHILKVKGPVFSRKVFELDSNCTYVFLYLTLKNSPGAADGLRPGQKVAVSYRDFKGALVADRIEQKPMEFAGIVRKITPSEHRLTLHRWIGDQQLQIAADCITVLGNENAGSLADIHPGDHVIVTYETSGSQPMAWQIRKTGAAAPDK